MALQVINLVREFSFKQNNKIVPLSDPNPSLTAEEVMKFYSGTYPELTNAYVEGPAVVNDKAVYTIKATAGKLG